MFANAAKVDGWNLSNPLAQGASTVYDATKNVVINGKDFVKDSWVKITPTASQVSKVLVRGAAGYALSVAVEQLIGAVDWVLDPANNQIRYKEKDSGGTAQPSDQYCYRGNISGIQGITTCYSTLESAAQFECPIFWEGSTFTGNVRNNAYAECKKDGSTRNATINYIVNPAYDPNAQPQDKPEKTLPLDVVSQKVISNAENGDTNAQAATIAAAADIVAEAETDNTKARPIANQAEANAETKPADAAEAEKANEAQGQTKPNEANPEATDISLEFPVFCSWAPTVCEAAQVVISFPQTLTGWWESANQRADEWETSISQAYHDFMRDDELPNDDTKVDITEHPVPELKEDAISWVSSCPADEYVPISLQGVTSTLVLSWSPWCQLLSIIKPAIIASAYIGAAFIVLGIRT